jgi:hypothetical protein
VGGGVMKTHSCISGDAKIYRKAILGYTDNDVRNALRERSNWYQHNMPDHRLWLRLLHQEVHKRGLGT